MRVMVGKRLVGRSGPREDAAMTDAAALIARLDLAPHPEGGWYRETWRAGAPAGTRAGATAILFLLEAGQRSHWHRVDAAELWLWHAGAPLRLSVAPDDFTPPAAVTLGGDVLAGETPQYVIPPGHWQAAEAGKGWALVSCVVSPAFEFAGFTLAPEGWAPGA
jgi:predicted cupin superfamily sugar epimerase